MTTRRDFLAWALAVVLLPFRGRVIGSKGLVKLGPDCWLPIQYLYTTKA